MGYTIELTRGKTFAPGDRVDVAGLNQLGLPTAAISGTVTNADIVDGSVTVPKVDFVSGSDVLNVFDILTKRPTFNPRAYAGESDREQIQAAMDACILAGGGVILIDKDYLLENPLDGHLYTYQHFLWAETASDTQLTIRGLYGARLINMNTAAEAVGIACLGVKGTFREVVVEGLQFERNDQTVANHRSVGVALWEAGQGLARVRVEGCHFRNVCNGVAGSGKGLRVIGNEFSYPIGHPTNSGADSYGVIVDPAAGLCEDLVIADNRYVGCEPTALPAGSVFAGWGLCNVAAMGVEVRGNRVRRLASAGVIVGARPLSGSNNWVSDPREILIGENRIEFDEITGATNGSRYGIYCSDGGATIAKNRMRGVFRGILATGANAGYDAGSDAATRLRRFAVNNNDVELAANLALDQTVVDERYGIKVGTARRVEVNDNTVQFAGRTSAGVTTKYGMVKGVTLSLVDDAKVADNDVFGPIDTTASAADFLWLTGLSFEYCRRVDVSENFLRNLNIGVNGAQETTTGVTTTAIELGRQRMEDVVWPYAALAQTGNDWTTTPATLHKRLRGTGYKGRVQRTSFLAFTLGYIRVGSFYNALAGRVRVWSSASPVVTVFDVAFYNDGTTPGGCIVQPAFYKIGAALITKARVCTGSAPADGLCHLDINVVAAPGSRVYVEFEQAGGDLGAGGLWGEPLLFSSMPAGFETRSATGEQELTFVNGLVIAGTNAFDQPHLVQGDNHIWRRASDGVMLYKSGAPANDSDGHSY